MKRRYISLAFLAVFIYILLIALLVRFESASPDASITGPGGAVWYTLTTLTTVGYGDTYPVTPGGRVIGALFQLMSIGVLVTLISTVLSLLRSRLLPLLMLSFKKNQHWYIFSEVNPRTRLMAEALAKEPAAPKKHMIIFFDSGTRDDGIVPAGEDTPFAFVPIDGMEPLKSRVIRKRFQPQSRACDLFLHVLREECEA